MAKGYRYYGDKLSIAAGEIAGAVNAGDLVDVGQLYGVVLDDGAAGEKNTLQVEGVFELAKATGGGTGGSKGAKANATGANLITAGAGTYVGVFWADAGDSDATALVKLIGTPA